MGTAGSRPAPSGPPKPSRARSSGTASHGWTPAPANGSPSCRSWSAAPPGSTRRGRACCKPPASARPGDVITAAGQTLTRAATSSASASIWAEDLATGKRRNLTTEEDHAFWAWAAIEVLRATGVRVEELVQLSHHSLVQYRLPSTGELVPLLQIAPSKTDAERLLVVSPELADVLSAVITRVRGNGPAVPLVAAYDDHERVWLPPPRCCSSGGSAPRTARSPPPPSARCSPAPSPAPG